MSGRPTAEIAPHLLAQLFREQSGRLVAWLTRFFGVGRVDVAEDVAQEALLQALQAWSTALPPDPTAWLFVVARHRALDVLRRERVRRGNGVVDAGVDDDALVADPVVGVRESDEDLLRLMFSCCHPALGPDAQSALILRLVGGFSTAEVAHAYLCAPATMEKRLVRAKRVLKDRGALVDVDAAGPAKEAVLRALYLMFDAGYHGSVVVDVVRADVCADALRLATLLSTSPKTADPTAHALCALCALHAARLPARVDADGLKPLAAQDRRLFDRALIARGLAHLEASAAGTTVSDFHLEAGIAAQHALATSVDDTRFDVVADLYDLLYAQKPTPVVALNRAIAKGRLVDAAAAHRLVRDVDGAAQLARYPFYWAALGDACARAGDVVGADDAFARGAAVARNDAERAMFARLREHSWSKKTPEQA